MLHRKENRAATYFRSHKILYLHKLIQETFHKHGSSDNVRPRRLLAAPYYSAR